MFGNGKSTLILKMLVVFLSIAIATAGFSVGSNSSRIIPAGKVSIVKDGKVVGEFSKEAPLPEGSFLRCEEKCALRVDDIFMVVEPGTTFSVTSTADKHELYVQEGTIYYSLSESSRPLHFSSPAGDATTGDLTMADSQLNGYVNTAGCASEIGVIGGGELVLATASGDMLVTPGNAITFESSEPCLFAAGKEEPGRLSKNQKLALGAATGVLVAAGAAALIAGSDGGGGGGGGSSSGSPASP
jgi:hypothetical protein